MMMMADTLGSVPAVSKPFFDRALLDRAVPILGMYKAGQRRSVPKNSGNQVSYRRLNALTPVSTALSEGVRPTPLSLSMTEITGTIQQYGAYVELSDTLNTLGIDHMALECLGLLAEHAAQSTEQIVRAELVTGTNVIFGTGTQRSAQNAANPLTMAMIRRAVRTLDTNDAKPFYGNKDTETGFGGLYIGFIHPRQWYDLVGDTVIQNTFAYSDPDKLYTLNLPVVGGVAWIKTTRAPVFTGAGASGADVYGAILCGSDAFGVVDVGGTGRYRVIAKDAGTGGPSDPLDQIATVGWKAYQYPKILNNSFLIRIETGVTD
ncbi:MAG: N4-gp56 family major capsid protein [Vampirovibrionales bacterium]